MKTNKIFALFLSLIIIISLATGCASSPKMEGATANEAPAMDSDNVAFSSQTEESKAYDENRDIVNDSEGSGNLALQDRKIIQSAAIEMETLNFDETVNSIIERTNAAGGYIESSNIGGRRINYSGTVINRNAHFRLRIPQNIFERFILEFGELGNVINSQTSGADITSEYFDTEARLESLKIQEERLLEILKKAGDIKDIIELERELSDIRYKIENYTGTIKKWDNLVSYATLEVNLYEVQEIKDVKENPVTLGQRISTGFTGSIKSLIDFGKELIIFLAAALPFLVILVAILFIVLYVWKKIVKRKVSIRNSNKNEDKNDDSIK